MNISIIPLTFLDLLILALAVLYAAQVITTKSGPLNVFSQLRSKFPDSGTGNPLHCVWCCAPYVAIVLLVLYLLVPFGAYPVYVLAICGGAMAIRSYTGVQHG